MVHLISIEVSRLKWQLHKTKSPCNSKQQPYSSKAKPCHK